MKPAQDSLALVHTAEGSAYLVTADAGRTHVNSRVLAEVELEAFEAMEQVVRVFNAHQSLVEALRDILDNSGKFVHKPAGQPPEEKYAVSIQRIERARAALKLAEGS